MLLLSFTLLTVSAFANDCEYVKDNEIVNINFDQSKNISMSFRQMRTWIRYFKERLTPYCLKDIESSKIMDNANRSLYFHRTKSDECDGGNSYGIIHDKFGKVVVEIQDGWARCPRGR